MQKLSHTHCPSLGDVMSSSFWAAATSSAVKPRYAVVPQLVMSADLDNIYKGFTPQVRSLPRDEYIVTVYD